MCGIAGGWHPQALPENVMASCLATMEHRGPDDYGYYQQTPMFIGMRRLSIIDLEGGHQPIFNEDHTIAVVQNGEVYNYKELIPMLEDKGHVFQTKSDTEVMVHLYEEYGTGMCEYLRGMYAFAIIDTNKDRMFMGRDRYGKKPFYYKRTQDGGLIFGSELKALQAFAKAVDEPIEISEQGIYDFLSLGVPPQPNTIFKDVYLLPSASWMLFDGENMHIEPYWELDYTVDPTITRDDALVGVKEVIAEAVKIRLRSDVPLGVLLSGGMDSSIVAYEASRELGSALQTFTIGVDDPTINEADIAQRTAKAFGVQNTVLKMDISPLEELMYLVKQYDQPFADPSAIPSLAVSRLARQHVKVVLNGDGGDELFVGYKRYVAAQQAEKFDWVPAGVANAGAKILGSMATNRRSVLGMGARFARSLGHSPEVSYLIRAGDMLRETDKEQYWRGNIMRPTEEFIASIPPLAPGELGMQLSRDVRIILLSALLVKMDIATMAASLEGRSPLMDHLVGEYAMSLPLEYHLDGQRTKTLLRDAYADVLPAEVTGLGKRGFEIPLASWLQNEMNDLLMDVLSPKNAYVRQYLTDEYVDGVIRGELMQERNWAYCAYSLLVLELWLRDFHDEALA